MSETGFQAALMPIEWLYVPAGGEGEIGEFWEAIGPAPEEVTAYVVPAGGGRAVWYIFGGGRAGGMGEARTVEEGQRIIEERLRKEGLIG